MVGMDQNLCELVERSGYDLRDAAKHPRVAVQVDDKLQPMALGPEVPVIAPGLAPLHLELQDIGKLYEGDRRPPDFSKRPPPDYELFFMTIERAAADFCKLTRRHELDREFERVYGVLRKRPDGRDANILFTYLRAAARLYMSLHPVSKSELEAVIDRLRKSAATFAMGPTSRNYFETIRQYVL